MDASLRDALAWIATRDTEFLMHLLKNPGQPLEMAHTAFMARTDPAKRLAGGDIVMAWQKLQAKILDGAIQIWGSPFEKGPHVNEIGVFDAPFSMEVPVSKHSPPRPIPSDIVASLVLDERAEDCRLRPSNWFHDGGWWWTEILFDWTELRKAFGDNLSAGSCGTSEAANQSTTAALSATTTLREPSPHAHGRPIAAEAISALVRFTRTELMVKEAVHELFPGGKIPRAKDRNKLIRDWFERRKLTQPSDPVISRTIRKLSDRS